MGLEQTNWDKEKRRCSGDHFQPAIRNSFWQVLLVRNLAVGRSALYRRRPQQLWLGASILDICGLRNSMCFEKCCSCWKYLVVGFMMCTRQYPGPFTSVAHSPFQPWGEGRPFRTLSTSTTFHTCLNFSSNQRNAQRCYIQNYILHLKLLII